MLGPISFGRRFRITAKSSSKSLLLALLAVSLTLTSGILTTPVVQVHAQGARVEYSLSNSGGLSTTPGNSGSARIVASLAGGNPTNVTLDCDLSGLNPSFAGTTCSFNPTSITPTVIGNVTTLTVTIPMTAPYGSYNITITSKAGSPPPLTPATVTLIVAAKVALSPAAISSQSISNQTDITFALNVTDSPPFSGFTGAVFFNEKVLQFKSVDYTGGVLGDDAAPSSECLDQARVVLSIGCNLDKSYDAVGVFSFALFTSSGTNVTLPAGVNTVNGKLFSVTFTVIHAGFSVVHFVQHEIQTLCTALCHTQVIYRTVAYDGYFTNQLCGGSLCKPPIVSFSPPLRLVALRPATFNATAISQNPGGRITVYNWTAGSGLARQYYGSPPPGSNKLGTIANFTFAFVGENDVTLSAMDNYGAVAYYATAIDVFRIWIDLGISSLVTDHTVGIFPGTVVHIVAAAANLGVNPENSTLRLSINNQNVATQQIVNLQPTLESSLTYDWHTAGLVPRVYRVQLNLDEIMNSTTGQILENDTAIIQGKLQDPNNVRIAFIQLIEPLPGGVGVFLGLTLPETLGLGIVVVAVAVFATGLVRRSRARSPEPL